MGLGFVAYWPALPLVAVTGWLLLAVVSAVTLVYLLAFEDWLREWPRRRRAEHKVVVAFRESLERLEDHVDEWAARR